MSLNIGINVIETNGSATPAIAGAATSTAGFCIGTARGVPNEPVFITSLAEFGQRFGGRADGSHGAHFVRGFFENGGKRAWVNRAVGDTADAASATLRQRGGAGANLLDLTAAYRGREDPGSWANGHRVVVRPSFLSQVTAGTDVNAGGATLQSVAGFSVGSRVVVSVGAQRHVATLEAVDPLAKSVSWAPDIAGGDLAGFQDDDSVVATVRSTIAVETAPADPTDDFSGTVLEVFEDVSFDEADTRYVVDVLNDAGRGSRFVMATDARAAANRNADGAPAARVYAELDGGDVDPPAIVDYVGAADDQSGVHAFDGIAIQLLAVDTDDPGVVQPSLDYCQIRDDCMFVGSVPQGSVASGQAVEYGAGFQGAKVYGALYGPWIKILDPDSENVDPFIWIPPTGHVLGVYARTEASRGISKAPAGDEARVLGALEVETRLSDVQHTNLVERGSVNGIRRVPGAGIVVDASRTLSTDTRWRYVNVRLLFNYVKSSLRDGLRWVRQEPNRDTLWTAVKFGSVRPFLLGLWRQGAFGTGEPDEVFTIVCDASNNPPDQVDLGIFALDVTFYPSKPAEKIVIRVGQQPSGSSASES